MGSPTEEVGDLINEEEEEEEVEIGKEEPGSGMTGMISTFILDPLISADQVKDEVAAPMLVAGMVVEEERKLGIETEMGIVVARLCQGP